MLVILFLALKCRASFLREQSQQFLCITLHNLNLGAKSKKLLVRNPNETCKPLKKALENWIKLAISQSGPAAMLKQKGLVHFHEHTGRNCAWGCFSLISSSIFSRELLSKGGQILLQATLFSVSSLMSSPPSLSFDLSATPFDPISCLAWQINVKRIPPIKEVHTS